jgi:hypothetical protein
MTKTNTTILAVFAVLLAANLAAKINRNQLGLIFNPDHFTLAGETVSLKTQQFLPAEQVTVLLQGSTTCFTCWTLPQTAGTARSRQVHRNGLLQYEGVEYVYTVATATEPSMIRFTAENWALNDKVGLTYYPTQ